MRCGPRTRHQELDSGLVALVAGSPHPLGPWLGLSRLSEANWFEAIISLYREGGDGGGASITSASL